VFSDSAESLQNGLDSLCIYSQRGKLKINVMKTKITEENPKDPLSSQKIY